MRKLNLEKVKEYVNLEIGSFHKDKIKCLESLNLKKLLKAKNPYLFRAKNLLVANDLYYEEKSKLLNLLSEQFIIEFCSKSGAIMWDKLVEFNSGNFDLNNY